MRTFFIADPHFGHKAVIEYENRPFASVEEMDEALITNWNNTVTKHDIVWLLGDVTLSTKKEYIKHIFSRLNGHIRFIKGNHDTRSDDFYRECGCTFVSRYPVILKEFFILSHAPLYKRFKAPYFNIYGHVHGNDNFVTRTENSWCVSVERQDYRPIQIPQYDDYVISTVDE
jgi:calcineurin-like phosphoesterase family protein